MTQKLQCGDQILRIIKFRIIQMVKEYFLLSPSFHSQNQTQIDTLRYNIPDMVENLNPMDLLKEELDSDQVAARVNCIHKLRIVGTLLGTDGIKNVLLPFLDGLIRKEEDQVLFAIAEQLGVLAPMLGNHQMAVMPILEGLCGQDETVVRDMAVKSLIGIMVNASDADINNYFTPMIMRLAINEANFTCRVSAANLMCKVYKRAGPGKEKLRQKFTELSNEQTPMVRRVIAVKIGQMATVYEKQYIVSDLIPAFKQLSNDDQDLVRVLCLDSLNSLAKVLSREDNKTHMLPVIIQAAEDKSWRVRLALSKNFAEIAESFGKEITDLSLVQTFSTLLKDVENDVKIEAVKSLSRFVKLVSADKLSILMPLIMTLGKDSSSIVRSNVTSVLCNVVSLVPRDQAYQKLLPLISDMMKDDNQDVRQGAIRAICRFGEHVGHEILTTILPLLKLAAEDPKWRVRNQVIHGIVSLALAYQNYEIFVTKNLEQLYMYYLKDKAAAVRQFGIEKIPQLVKAFGNNWVNSFITKLTDTLLKDSIYSSKITAIYSLQMLALSPGGEVAVDKVFGLISKSLTDTVPNVRLVSAKALRQLAHKYEVLRDPVKKTLTALSEDPDKDVKFYVLEAINSS